MILLPSNVLFLLGHDHYYDKVAVTGIILLYNVLVRQLLDGCCCTKKAFPHILADESACFQDQGPTRCTIEEENDRSYKAPSRRPESRSWQVCMLKGNKTPH
jgi:hypothetical protein